ncbi:Dimer-Tnp-hAT domain containing protein [Pyrenophora tritici-repentis]|nr:Dimer-Tnp-hAT domain containing protein [Pyrenophora tritici-repentis]
MDDAIDGLINPSASINNTIDDDKFERWKRSEPRAEKGGNYANNPIKYWVELRDRYPNLSKLALDVLSILALSCECERLFSELGDLLEPRRRAIKPQLLAATQCVDCWLINTEHPRRPKTYANALGRKKLDAALAANNDLRDKINKALDKWRAKQQESGGSIAIDDGNRPTRPTANTVRYIIQD